MLKRTNSDDEEENAVASNASSDDQNESDSDQEEKLKHSPKTKPKIDSDESEQNKSEESSDESEDDEQRKLNLKKNKKLKKSSPFASDGEDKSDNSNNSDGKKSAKSNEQKSDKSDKSDDDEIFSPKKKTKKIMDSDLDSDRDSENESKKIKQERVNEDLEDIFGELSDEEEELNKKSTDQPKHENDDSDADEKIINLQRQQREEARDIFQQFEEDEDEQVPETETRIEIEIPKINVDLGKESHFVKLPNFLSVDTHPYDPSWYEDEIDEDEICDDEGRARMKLKVENTIRWRNVPDKDGNMMKESNARIIKWSDGSMSLHLGSEIFDIHKQHLLSGDNNHLYIRQGIGLQGQTVFKTKLTFRPHSTDSFTHKKMTLSLADRSLKTQKIRVLPTVGLDPEANRTDRIKKEEDKLRASLRRENKARRVRERVNQRGPSASYLEPDIEEDEDGAISLSAIKNKYKQRGSYADVYSDSESSKSSNDSIFNKKKSANSKRTGKIEESEEE